MSDAGSDIEKKTEETNVKVMVRVRLFNKREIEISKKKKELLQPAVKMRGTTCAIVEYTKDDQGFTHEREREAFEFDECFWSMPIEQATSEMPIADQRFVYERSGYLALQHAYEGFNVCIFAYGQTGSGKTYSMLGAMPHDPGISPRLVDDLFARIENEAVMTPTTKCVVECMFFEIYNEKVRDLFNKKSKSGEYDNPRIRQHPTRGTYVEGLMHKEVSTAGAAKTLIEKGTNERAMAETRMNKHSSRSHAVFQIQVTQNDAMKGTQRVSTINLVDLAGSEKIKMSGATGDTFTEAKNINLSLSTLRRVIDTLIENSTSKRQKVPPFRESVLTHVLSDSLGGNSKTQMLSTISPHESNLEDSLGTLRYALRAKAIVCTAHVNEEKSAAMMDAMKEEIMKLRANLANGTGGGGGGQMMPEDIKREIAVREKEMEKMEANKEKMEALLEESKAKEEQLQQKFDEVQDQQQQLEIQMTTAKRERFASAFRNAFLISQDKKRIEVSKQELTDAQLMNEELEEKVRRLEESNTRNEEELRVTSQTLRQREDELEALKTQSDAHIGALTKQNAALSEDKASLQKRLDEEEAHMAKLSRTNAECEGRLQRMQDDMMGMSRRVEQVLLEKQRVKETLEAQAHDQNMEMEQLRKRKEKYKAMLVEEQSRSAALRLAVDDKMMDRSQLIQTIRAQEQLLQERQKQSEHLRKEADTALNRADEAAVSEQAKKEDIRILSEALKEYQGAATKWMSEHSAMDKELSQLRQQVDSTRVRYDFPTSPSAAHSPAADRGRIYNFPGGSPTSPAVTNPTIPSKSTPRRTQSPSAAAVRSPYFRQPAIASPAASSARGSSPLRRWSTN